MRIASAGYWPSHVWIAAAVFVISFSYASAGDSANDGADMAKIGTIVVSGKPVEAYRQTADLLRNWLGRVYPEAKGLKFKEDMVVDASIKDVILLGPEAALAARMATKEELEKVKPGGYVIKCQNGRIAIAGADAYTTHWGAVGFLEKIGFRFYYGFPLEDQNPLPKPKDSFIASFSLADKPAFLFRTGIEPLFKQSWAFMADPCHALNPELFTKEAGSDQWVDHTAGYLLPKELYYDAHPEYYAMLEDGKRIAKDGFSHHRTPLCLSNPDVTRIAIERALAWVELQPQKQFFNINFGDTPVYCHCPECAKLDVDMPPPDPSQPKEMCFTQRHFRWANAVAKAIGERFPDKTVITLAYMGSGIAPLKLSVEPNVIIPYAGGLASLYFWSHAFAYDLATRDKYWGANGDRWLALAPGKILIVEYYDKAYQPVMLDSITNRLRYYKSRNVGGVYATYGKPDNFASMWLYVWSKMLWNPDQDPFLLAQDFLSFHFGEAGEPVLNLFKAIHRQYEDTLKSKMPLVNERPQDFYAEAFAKECLSYFAKAEELLADNAKLLAELRNEELLLLADMSANLPASGTVAERHNLLAFFLARQYEIAQTTKKEKEFVKSARQCAATMEKREAGYAVFTEEWLKKNVWWMSDPKAGNTDTGLEKAPKETPNADEDRLDAEELTP